MTATVFPTETITEADFHRYVAEGAGRLTPRTLHALFAELPGIRETFPRLTAAGFPRAERQLRLLAEVVERTVSDQHRDLPYGAVLEAAFALLYFHRDTDLIPDALGGTLGYVDDAAVIGTVLARHAGDLAEFARTQGFPWEPAVPDRGAWA